MIKISNALTISRIVLAPFVLFFILQKSWAVSIILLAVAFATDLLDGYLARKLKQETTLGKVLDPVADKILVFFALFGLLYVFGNQNTNWIYGIMFFSKDIFSFFFIILTLKFTVKKARARILGKAATVAQAAALFWLILGLDYYAVWIWIVFAIGLASGIDYYLVFRRNLKKRR